MGLIKNSVLWILSAGEEEIIFWVKRLWLVILLGNFEEIWLPYQGHKMY